MICTIGICEVIYKRMNQPWLRYPFIFSLLGYQAKQEEDLKVLHGMTNKVIEEKRKLLENKSIANGFSEDDIGVKRKTAFLELLLGMMANASKTFISTQDIREEVDTFMFEGHDTTTSSLCYTLHLLSKHRDVQDKVYKEIEAAGLIEKDPSYADLQELKYLERVIKESLRLYPAVPIVARHLYRDLTINSGYTLPKGCIVGVSAYFIHRNEEHYTNPEEFNPDNFLPEPAATRHPYAYVPFSAGPRNCIGQKFAMLELKATVVKVLKNFVLEDAGREWDPEPNPTLILQSVNGFHLGLTHR